MSTATAPTANDQFRQKAQEIKDNIVDMAGIARDAARDKLVDAKDAACEKFSDARDAAASRYHAGVDKAGRARDGLLDYVKENPSTSLLACLCAGALAGFLISRRR